MTRNPSNCIFGDRFNKIPRELRIMLGNLVLIRSLEERMEELNIRDGLTKPERHMLINLGVPRRMGQMAEDLNTQPSNVTAVADLLEGKGLVVRERDAEDRRAWQLRLTETGASARKELITVTVALFREITGLSESEIEQMAAVFDRVTEHILKSGFPKGLTL